MIHGHAKKSGMSPTYMSWASMIQRCTNPKRPYYKHYGGKGVRVCPEWFTFANFLADMGERPDGCSLDRIDNDGHYERSNCRWASNKVQASNTSQVVKVVVNGDIKTLKEWCELYGISVNTVRDRVKYHGMTYEDAITTPKQRVPFARTKK